MPCKVTRRFILQKARHHAFRADEALIRWLAARLAIRRWPPGPRPTGPRLTRHSALTVCKRSVSGSISLPSRGSFHLSLTVLVRYRSPRVFSLGRWSSQVPTGFHVSRGTQEFRPRSLRFRLPDSHRLWWGVPAPSANGRFGNWAPLPRAAPAPTTPGRQRRGPITPTGFGLFPFRSPLLRESRLILLPRGT